MKIFNTRKSAWAEMTGLKFLFCWLIIPIIVAIVVAKNYRVEATDKTLKVYSGVFNKRCEEYAVAGITEMSVYNSFWGGICNYGTVNISLAGNRNVHIEGIKNANSFKIFLQKKLVKTANATHVLTN